MKKLNKVLMAAAVAATFGLACNANAQYRPTGPDGITASPKVRQMLDERTRATPVIAQAPSVMVTYRNPAEGVTASPKVRQMLAEQKVVVNAAPSTEVASVGYRATGWDGITASPKVRQQLDERGTGFMIAPVK